MCDQMVWHYEKREAVPCGQGVDGQMCERCSLYEAQDRDAAELTALRARVKELEDAQSSVLRRFMADMKKECDNSDHWWWIERCMDEIAKRYGVSD